MAEPDGPGSGRQCASTWSTSPSSTPYTAAGQCSVGRVGKVFADPSRSRQTYAADPARRVPQPTARRPGSRGRVDGCRRRRVSRCGARLNVEPAQQAAGDGRGRCWLMLRTSDPESTEVGDIAAAEHPLLGTRVRTEHWANTPNNLRWRLPACWPGRIR